MKKIALYVVLLTLAAGTVCAQKKLSRAPRYEEWADKPVFHDVPPEYAGEPAIILHYDVTRDYRYEGRKTETFFTLHRLVKVLDDRGIEMFNKVEFSVPSRTRVPLVKARTILPGGKVRDIPKDMIKVTKNEYGQYMIVFAMEGVEKNAEVELLIQEIRQFSAFGSETFQFPVPVLSSRFELSYPKEMMFEEKGYNGYPTQKDTLLHGRRHIQIEMADIPALKPERYSLYDLHRMRAEFRIHKFLDENSIDTLPIFTWDNFVRELFNEHYDFSTRELEAVNRYLVTLDARPSGNELDNIRKIENGIKKDITLYPDMDEDNQDDLDSIIAHKGATQAGMLRLFAACFTQCQVKHELGATYDRSEHRYDKDFENWGNLDEYLFYFPGQKGYLSPLQTYRRFPIVPQELLGTMGVFCSIPPKRDVTGPMADLRRIDALPAEDNQHNIAASVSFDKKMDPTVDISYSWTGYAAAGMREQLLLEPKDKEKEFVQGIVSFATDPAQIVKYTIGNRDMETTATKQPLEVTATVHAATLTDKAGKTWLLQLGALLGTHSSFFDNKPRVLPVDMDYPTSYTRTLTVNIPKGYRVLNADVLTRHVDYVNRDLKAVISFDASYTLKKDHKKGDKLVVRITENYPKAHFPVQDFQRFRAVVDAAADYTHTTVLLGR